MTDTATHRYLSADSTDITDCLDMTVMALNATSALHYALQYPGLTPYVYGYSKGKKYARVFFDMDNGQRMVAFFVQMDNGDVWKADGWKAPALNFTRGNILTVEGRKALTLDKMHGIHFYPGF